MKIYKRRNVGKFIIQLSRITIKRYSPRMRFALRSMTTVIMFAVILLQCSQCTVQARSLTRPEEALNSIVYDQLRYPDLDELEEVYRAANAGPIKRAVRLMRLG
ncbi:hypothetical protein D915_001019 [Fasciola hepatica]|uniref:Uncharacterized protein n=1 Tax=Fasciola hepatica TaxID=6192 RepID=A0A4E0RXM0_FASHE|nr:hypothetical protein D915_001019 [Fasciola hepatica]